MNGLGAVLAAALAVSTSPAGGAASSGLVETVDRFEKLHVGTESFGVSNLRLASGHVACVLASGHATPVLAGDEVVGLFFEGNGTVEYLSVDGVEAPVVTFVARKGTSLTPEKTSQGIRLRDKFDRLLWLAAGEPVPPLSGASNGPPLAAGFGRQREKFHQVFADPLSHAFAREKLDAPAAPLVWAEMDGGAENLVYEHDGMGSPRESLRMLHPSESTDPQLRKGLWSVTLSEQPLGWDRRDPQRPQYLLTDVDVELAASAGDDAKLTVVETVVAQGESRRVLRFDLESLLFARSGANLGTRAERLRGVTDESGRSLSWDHRNSDLLVHLAEPAAPDRPVKLKFEIDGDFLVRPGGDSYWELGVWPWFPQPELGAQYYTFHALMRVKKPFLPFAPGTTLRRETEGDENVLETRVDKPIQFAAILAGAYEVSEETRHGVKIRVATYALKNSRAMKQLTDLADSIITFYTEFLGPFPLPEFNILEINSWGFGQAPPGTMFITKEAFNPLSEETSQLFSQGVNERFAHEIAHQYWGIVVKMPSFEEQWITESFAEYSAAIFLRAARGEAIYQSVVNHWKPGASFANDAAPIPMANRVWVANDVVTRWHIRRGLLYDKGPLLLAALHRELGDEAFLTFLKSYQKSFRWKFGSTKTVAGLLQFMTKKDYSPFFEANYWGTGMPKN